MDAVQKSPSGDDGIHPSSSGACMDIMLSLLVFMSYFKGLGVCSFYHSVHYIRDYTHHVKGFVTDVDLQLIQTADFATLKEQEKYVCLWLDEMHVKEDHVYD